MKTLLSAPIVYILLAFGFASCSNESKEKKTDKPATSRHSKEFNASVEKILDHYYNLSEAFVNWDDSGIKVHSTNLKISLDSFALDELLSDSVVLSTALEPLSNARVEIGSIVADPSLEEKRASFNLLSDNLKAFLTAVRLDTYKIYWQECPMAFDDTKPGYWLSRVDSIRNPYLGTKHPKYGRGMLECGETKEVLDFSVKDSPGK